MKKTIFAIAIILGISSHLNAQNNINVGIKAGMNYSNIYDSHSEQFNADSKAGLAAGGFITIPIGKFLAIQPEILYSQKGYKTTGVLLGNTYNLSRTTTFLDIPLLVAIKPTNGLSIVLGPQYSYLMREKNVFSNSVTSIEQQHEFENNNIRKNTLCMVAGFDINVSKIVIGIRSGWDLQNNNGDGTSSNPRYKNAYGQLTLGFNIL